MARLTVKKTIIVCDRDAFDKAKPATQERTFALEDRFYKLMLCDAHAEQFDREFNRWTMLAEEIDTPEQYGGRPKSQFFTAERQAETRRIREASEAARHLAAHREFAQRRRAEIDAEELARREETARERIPGAKPWHLTSHARLRMAERGVDIEDVLGTAAMPEQSYRQPWRGHDIVIKQAGECRLVCNDSDNVIITVIDRHAPLETAETYRQSTGERTAL